MAAAAFLAYDTTRLWKARLGLPLSHQLATWAAAIGGLALPLASPPHYFLRLLSIFLGTVPAYVLFSISYEPLFLAVFGGALLAWLLAEANLAVGSVGLARGPTPPSTSALADEPLPSNPDAQAHRHTLQWADARLALAYLTFNSAAFFGTGNFASIASFELSSVYRFTVQFNPFVMGALLMIKLFIPLLLVACAFSAVLRLLRRPRFGIYLIVLLLSDVMSIHFFFMVSGVGSWMEIGNSLSRFGILNSQVLVVLLLFALSHIYTWDLTYDGEASLTKLL